MYDGFLGNDRDAELADNDDGALLRIDDTVGALVTIRGSPTLIVCEVSQIVSASGHPVQPSHGLPISELEDIRTTVSLWPLSSEFKDGPPAALCFTGDSAVPEQRVQAPFVQPIQLATSPTGFSVESSAMSSLATHLASGHRRQCCVRAHSHGPRGLIAYRLGWRSIVRAEFV